MIFSVQRVTLVRSYVACSLWIVQSLLLVEWHLLIELLFIKVVGVISLQRFRRVDSLAIPRISINWPLQIARVRWLLLLIFKSSYCLILSTRPYLCLSKLILLLLILLVLKVRVLCLISKVSLLVGLITLIRRTVELLRSLHILSCLELHLGEWLRLR